MPIRHEKKNNILRTPLYVDTCRTSSVWGNYLRSVLIGIGQNN